MSVVGGPGRKERGRARVSGCDLVLVAAVPVHHPEIHAAVAVADERDLRAVRGPGRRLVDRRVVRQVLLAESVEAGGVDLVVSGSIARVGNAPDVVIERGGGG